MPLERLAALKGPMRVRVSAGAAAAAAARAGLAAEGVDDGEELAGLSAKRLRRALADQVRRVAGCL